MMSQSNQKDQNWPNFWPDQIWSISAKILQFADLKYQSQIKHLNDLHIHRSPENPSPNLPWYCKNPAHASLTASANVPFLIPKIWFPQFENHSAAHDPRFEVTRTACAPVLDGFRQEVWGFCSYYKVFMQTLQCHIYHTLQHPRSQTLMLKRC